MKTDLDLRCQCSRLLFRKSQDAIEIKCPRCKRIHLFNVAQLTAFLQAGNFCAVHNSHPSEARDQESNAPIKGKQLI